MNRHDGRADSETHKFGVRYRYAPVASGWLVTFGVEHEAQASLPMIFASGSDNSAGNSI
jgi:hypothetical protein